MKKLFLRYKWLVASIILLSMAIAVISACLAVSMKYLFDRNGSDAAMSLFMGAIALQRFLSPLLTGALAYTSNELSVVIESDLRHAIYQHALDRPYSADQIKDSSALQKQLHESIVSTRNLCTTLLRQVVAIVIEVALSLLLAYYFGGGLVFLSLFIGAIFYVTYAIFTLSKKSNLIEAIRDSEEKLSSYLNDEFAVAFIDGSSGWRKRGYKTLVRQAGSWKRKNSSFMLITNLRIAFAAVLFTASFFLFNRTVLQSTTGMLVFLGLTVSTLIFQLNAFALYYRSVIELKVDLSRIQDVLSIQTSKKMEIGKSIFNATRIQASVMFRLSDVQVKRWGNILNLRYNLNVAFTPGVVNLISGDSGAGKTTLVELISGRLNVAQGSIRAQQHVGCTKEMQDFDFREQSTIVRQKDEFYICSLYENLVMGNFLLSPESVYPTLNTLGLESFADCESMKTILGPGNRTISGGEAKRLSIARGLLQSPSLLIIDEPFAGLDPENCRMLAKVLHHQALDKLIVVVSHNLGYFDEARTNQIRLRRDGRDVSAVPCAKENSYD